MKKPIVHKIQHLAQVLPVDMINEIRVYLAIRFEFLRPYLLTDKECERLAIQVLRQNFALFGHNCSDMTDEEIKEGLINVSKNIGSFGASAEEAAMAFKALSKVMHHESLRASE